MPIQQQLAALLEVDYGLVSAEGAFAYWAYLHCVLSSFVCCISAFVKNILVKYLARVAMNSVWKT